MLLPRHQKMRARLDAYKTIVGAETIHRLRELSRPMRRKRVLHISNSASATHHARTLSTALTLLAELDLDVRWTVLSRVPGRQGFSQAGYQAIDGRDDTWHSNRLTPWRERRHSTVAALDRSFDLVVVHDPELLALRRQLTKWPTGQGRWWWHCHLDLGHIQPAAIERLETDLIGYAGVALEDAGCACARGPEAVAVIPAVIDSLAARNLELPPRLVDATLRRLGIRTDMPLVVQVSPSENDSLVALRMYRSALDMVPGLQLAMVAGSDVECRDGTHPFEKLAKTVRDEPGVLLLRAPDAGDIEINALQSVATVALQSAAGQALSPALLEASWKGRPVLAGESGASRDQVIHGRTGFVVRSVADGAQRIAQLVADPMLADALGFEGHRWVRENHLVIRWVEEYLNLMAALPQEIG